MILQKEIAAIAEKKGVPKTTIDKDWALGHFLDAIKFFILFPIEYIKLSATFAAP